MFKNTEVRSFTSFHAPFAVPSLFLSDSLLGFSGRGVTFYDEAVFSYVSES